MRVWMILGFVFVFVNGCETLPPVNMSPDQPHLSVVTYNVNWGGRGAEYIADYLQEADADIVCLQETHQAWETFLVDRLKQQYPYRYFEHRVGAGGIAFLSKYQMKNIQVIEAKSGWFPALKMKVVTPVGELVFVNVHLRPPLNDVGRVSLGALYSSPERHRIEIAEILEGVKDHGRVIVAGDFNEHEDDGAVYEMRSMGYSHALSHFDRHTNTWQWNVFPLIELKNRYDHLLYGEDLHCTGAVVKHIDASDHHPLMGVFVKKQRKNDNDKLVKAGQADDTN